MAVVFVDDGEEYLVDLLDGTSSLLARFIAWGTGGGAAAKGDSALTTEDTDGRATGVQTQVTPNEMKAVGTITSTGSKTIIEAGLFDVVTDSSGTLIVRTDHGSQVLVTDDAIEYTFTLTFT